ncbi:3-oxoacyl-ACP reductase [Planotetraspora silvatica]|uniref:3-oxoacyl-ACP reductase n=1 Tax=Planotetraspora silvatica TaxID=234614 RepID=A0A8J3XRW7_9ACTN|nr:SDR family oxidoreductase [Planotetraspora silvatica]GII49881.1 3-oxoacyl-ACP reductase [Planotetraspora silvatica]
MADVSRRVVIVTGGSRGIGRRVAARLAAQGFGVVVGYGADKARAEEAVAQIAAAGGAAVAVGADVADEIAVTELFDAAEREFGGVDVVVHSAGILPLGALADFDLQEFDRVVRTNLRGTFVVDQQAARRLRPGGAIINFSSSVTRFANPGNAAYTATKGAVEAITLVLARELRGRDITVNAVAPGAVDSEMLTQFLQGREEQRAQIAAQSPLERLGTPDDIAEVVEFLAGPARWVNGQVLYANGGAI